MLSTTTESRTPKIREVTLLIIFLTRRARELMLISTHSDRSLSTKSLRLSNKRHSLMTSTDSGSGN